MLMTFYSFIFGPSQNPLRKWTANGFTWGHRMILSRFLLLLVMGGGIAMVSAQMPFKVELRLDYPLGAIDYRGAVSWADVSDLTALHRQGLQLLKAGKATEADALFRRGVREQPTDYLVWRGRIDAARLTKQLPRLVSEFFDAWQKETVLERRRVAGLAFLTAKRIAVIDTRMSATPTRYSLAEGAAKDAWLQKPTFSLVEGVVVGSLANAWKGPAEERAVLERTLRRYPDSVPLRIALVLAYSGGYMVNPKHRKDPDRAIFHAQAVLRLEPRNANAHYLLGLQLYETGNRAAARKHLQMFLDLKPEPGNWTNTARRLLKE